MIEKTTALDAASLKKLFQNERNNSFSPYIFLPLNMTDDGDIVSTKEHISKLIVGYKKSGFGGVIPFVYKSYNIHPLTAEYEDVYRHILKETEQNGISLAYQDDSYIMREYLCAKENRCESVCKILSRYEYACRESDVRRVKLHSDSDIMSVVAVSDEQEIIDLREFVSNGELEWEVPIGNWTIEEYVCECDNDSHYIDLMDYGVCNEYLKSTFVRLFRAIGGEKEERAVSPIATFFYRNVVYAGQNRRMWHRDFNKLFEELYGFDPAPYYPILFSDFAGSSNRYKCMFMTCRAKMLTDGYVKAVADCCFARNIFCTGHTTESKTAACSWMFGDGQMIHKYSSAPGISMPFAYLYGINAVKVAAGAADAMGCDTVSADLFKYFSVLTKDVMYREAMNGFVRGVNMTFAHLGLDRVSEEGDIEGGDEAASIGTILSKGNDVSDFASYVTRTQTLLRGGEHISDVAILYPITTLHSLSYLYYSETKEFEYSSTPENTDYMEIMNDFLSYVGVDATFLHPDIMTERAFSENGKLYIDNGRNAMKFKIIILPSMSLVSLRALRVIKKFYDNGGKIIATSNLPFAASECSEIFDDVNKAIHTRSTEDGEVEEIIKYIFGDSVTDNKIYRSYYKNTNEAGGIAYFFPSDKATVDGTYISASILAQAVRNLGLCPDVYIDKMPRREFPGIVNYHLPAFLKFAVGSRLARSSSMNCLHKKYAGCDIYYLTNTTSETYNGKILFRGKLSPEEWNPYNGKIRKLAFEIVRFRGEIYTLMDAVIEPSSSVFVVSNTQRTQKETIRDLTADEYIREFFPKEDF